MESSVISINGSDVIENLDHLLDKSNIFQTSYNIDYIKCYIFYSEKNQLLNFKKVELDIYDNIITKKELLALILKHNKLQSKRFDLTGIYKYELNIDEDEIKQFCKSQKDFSFITQYYNVEDIQFTPCIELFNDNNTLILFFSRISKIEEESKKQPKKEEKKNKTQKKVKFKEIKETNNKTMKNMENEIVTEIKDDD
tara:strand:- start:7827 stop:8417 length:591 start_codon:yes stop_codon:yes gene_type:complete